jgi:O-methyltransferase
MIPAIKKIIPEKIKDLISRVRMAISDQYYFLPKSKITYSHDLLYTFHNADFLKDPLFIESYKLGKQTDKGMLLPNYDIEWRIHVLCWAAKHASHLQGDFVDCGVHTGIFARSVINFIDFNKTRKKYYLLDTFEGLSGEHSSSEEIKRNSKMGYEDRGNIYEQVKKTFADFNVTIIKGAVPVTLPRVTSDKICFLSVDMNCVKPERDALNFFWDKMVPGGIIILDDYGYANSTNDQKKMHDEFARSKGVMVLTLPTCQGIIIKP